jgi:hypothetical protein
VRTQGRPVQAARWDEIMERERILLGEDWNAHSDRWDPQCPPKRDDRFHTKLMDESNLTGVTDGEETHYLYAKWRAFGIVNRLLHNARLDDG